jgi:arylsulfatase A-like enzyme
LYPHQAGVGHMVDQAGPEPGYANDLSPRSRTIAQVLKGAGYQTGMTGKWHVTPANQSHHNGPLQRGFDRYFGIIHGAADYFNPATLTYGNDPVSPEGSDYYFTDAWRLRGTASWTNSRGATILTRRLPRRTGRFMRGPTISASTKAATARAGTRCAKSATPGNSTWECCRNGSREWQARRMEVYAAQVDRMDQNVGRILTKLRETGREKNTLVLFMSDNGGCAEEAGPRWSGLHIPKATRDGRPVRVGNDPSVMPGSEDTYQKLWPAAGQLQQHALPHV